LIAAFFMTVVKFKQPVTVLLAAVEVSLWLILCTLLIELWWPGFFAGIVNFNYVIVGFIIFLSWTIALQPERQEAWPWLVMFTLAGIILSIASVAWPTRIASLLTLLAVIYFVRRN
jgi:hypothetical protein